MPHALMPFAQRGAKGLARGAAAPASGMRAHVRNEA